MEANDGAKIYELVGIFLLSLLSKKCNSDNGGSYRDDRLPVFRNINEQQEEKRRKNK